MHAGGRERIGLERERIEIFRGYIYIFIYLFVLVISYSVYSYV